MRQFQPGEDIEQYLEEVSRASQSEMPTTETFVAPRLTTANRDLIASPCTGMIIYNTTTSTYQRRLTSSWENFA